MGFLNSNLPPVEPDRLFDMPYLERVKVLLAALGRLSASARRR